MNFIRRYITIILFFIPFFSNNIWGQEESMTTRQPKITTSSNLLGIGGVNVLDTYLSPEKYSGTELRFLSETEWSRPEKRWSTMMLNLGEVSLSNNRADNAKDICAQYTFGYAMLYNINTHIPQLRLKVGGMADINLGVIYNNRNGNNPAQARAYLNLSPLCIAEYDVRLWNTLFTLRYEGQVALLGMMFSPNYGQSYYEIFNKGDYDHNLVFTTIGSAPCMRHQLTVDIPLRRSMKLRVGYMGDFQQAKANDLKSHIYSNMFMIGITRQFQIINL